MAFKDIFNSSRNTSNIAAETQTVLSGYLAKQPNEDITVPPHDPYLPPEKTQQDPKIIRETSPQAHALFGHLNSLTSEVMSSSNNLDTTMSDPGSVVNPSSGVMHTGYEDANKMHETTPSPGAKTPHASKPSRPESPATPNVPTPPSETPNEPDDLKKRDQQYGQGNHF